MLFGLDMLDRGLFLSFLILPPLFVRLVFLRADVSCISSIAIVVYWFGSTPRVYTCVGANLPKCVCVCVCGICVMMCVKAFVAAKVFEKNDNRQTAATENVFWMTFVLTGSTQSNILIRSILFKQL